MNKTEILSRICYTELVYGRINKKLKTNVSNDEIEELMIKVIQNSNEQSFQKIGKNYYISNEQYNIRVTINSFTFRVITVDKI
jgi:predicted DNA binding CopG/RHH family protein